MIFCSLHTHTTFSFGDGAGIPDYHMERLADLGYLAAAATEHGNTASHPQWEKAGAKHGVKPIFGLEAYTAPPKEKRKFHQTVMAMDNAGYHNLNQLVSMSYAKGFYQWPTIHPEWWADHAEGLIVTSGCADSLLSCTLLGGKSLGEKRERASRQDMRACERVIRQYQEWFGDRYYLEVQRFPGLKRACTLNPAFAELSRRTGVPLVATADVHYPYPSENAIQRILHAAHRGGTVEQMDASWEYSVLLTYPTSDKEITDDLIGTGLTRVEATSSIRHSNDIAQRCNVTLPKAGLLRYPIAAEDFLPWQ